MDEKLGFQCEQYILFLLQRFHLHLPTEVTGPFSLTGKNSKDDANGIDIWVGTQYGDVGLQVKRSHRRASNRGKRRRDYEENGIAFITLRSRIGKIKKDRILVEELVTALSKAIQHKKEKYHG